MSTGLTGLTAVDTATRREHVHALLRDAISSGTLAPGTHLAETELSAQLGVSRGTLREALRHLQQEGLVSADARGRLFVCVVTRQEVDDIFSVRHALESLALELLCARADRTAETRALCEALDRLAGVGGDFPALLDADFAFHELLCALSGNATLLRGWRSVCGLARAAATAAGPTTARHNMAVERHAPIVTFVARGDAAGGREFLREHMRDAGVRIIAQMGAASAALGQDGGDTAASA